MAEIVFIDNTVKVKGNIENLAMICLEEVSGELESQVKRNTAVKTGKTKNSWRHVVVKVSDNEFSGIVGSDYDNAIWEEFGTGEYALNGDGRKGGWYYVDEEGNGHFTHGKHPRRPLWYAYTMLKSKMIKHIQDVFRGGLK